MPDGIDASAAKTIRDMARIYLSQMAIDGYFPYDTVTTAGTAVSKGMHLQMGCGEGKTGVCVFGAASTVMNGERAFLTSSTKFLAEDTFKDTLLKFEELGLNNFDKKSQRGDVVLISQDKITYGTMNKDGDVPTTDSKGRYEIQRVEIKKEDNPSKKSK